MMEDADDLNKRVGQITKKNNKLNEVLVLLIEAVVRICSLHCVRQSNVFWFLTVSGLLKPLVISMPLRALKYEFEVSTELESMKT